MVRLFIHSNDSWQKWMLLLILLGIAAMWISPVSASAATDWIDKGNPLYNAGRYDEALAAYNKAIELEPNLAYAWFNKGNTLAILGRYNEELAAFNKVIELEPNHAGAWYNKGNSLNNLGRYDEALVAFNKAIELEPNNAKAWTNKAIALDNLGRSDESLAASNKAIELDPKDAFHWINKGAALYSLGRYDEMLTASNKAIELNPNDAKGWCNKGLALNNLGRSDEALVASNKAIELNPNLANAWSNKADALNSLGRYDEALTASNKAIGLNPVFPDAWNNKGGALSGLDRSDEALVAYNKAIELNPNNTKAWNNKGATLKKLGQYDEALAAYNKAIELDPRNAYAWYNKGVALDNLHRYDEALAAYNKAIELNPNFTIAISVKNMVLSKLSQNVTPSTTIATSTSSTSSSDLPLIIFGIIILLCLGVGGYYILHSRKMKPSKDFHPADGVKTPRSTLTINPTTPNQLPQELSDRYKDFELIGKGGFARVFKVTRIDGKHVALKIPISLDSSTGKTFIAELQNWTKLDHPNIVRVFDYNIMPLPYFEMELCDGSLAEAKIPMDCEEAAWIVFHICEGLKYAHARSIAHRDLKPQNILLKDNISKISDWGLSRIISKSTSTTTGSFTPYYAAPEQVNNKQKDERTDIWQLGVILYELTTGTLPFKGESVVEVVVSISTKSYTPPSELNPDTKQIESFISLCLQKDPDKRFQSVTALQTALGMYLRKNYAELFRQSVTVKDIRRSVYYVGDLVIVNLIIGDLNAAYKYSTDLAEYAKGDAKVLAHELCEHLYIRIQNNVTEIPDELLKKAEFVIHKVLMGF